MDRAALDAAIKLGLEYGGWVPKGRLAEDGKIPLKYKLRECDSKEYPVRTEMNVKEGDATLILCRGPVKGGTQFTHFLCLKHQKPVGLVSLDAGSKKEIVEAVKAFIEDQRPKVLNVAGPRESGAPGIYKQAFEILCKALKD